MNTSCFTTRVLKAIVFHLLESISDTSHSSRRFQIDSTCTSPYVKIDAFIADQMLDEAAILAESTFPISPEVGTVQAVTPA